MDIKEDPLDSNGHLGRSNKVQPNNAAKQGRIKGVHVFIFLKNATFKAKARKYIMYIMLIWLNTIQ